MIGRICRSGRHDVSRGSSGGLTILARVPHEPPSDKQNNKQDDSGHCQQGRLLCDFGHAVCSFRSRFPRQHDPEQLHRQLDVFQIRRTKLFKPGLERIANLPLHVRGNADPACTRQLFDARSDVDAVTVNIAVAVNHVADVDAYFEFNPPVGCDVMIALRQCALDFNGALRGLQGAAEFD